MISTAFGDVKQADRGPVCELGWAGGARADLD